MSAWWRRRVTRASDPAWRLYRAVAAPAVAAEARRRFGLADTPEARFELLALHLAALWTRLDPDASGAAGAGAAGLTRLRPGLAEAFVADMDASLRDMGAGDGVGRRVKALTERLYGRIEAYRPALAEAADAALIDDALARNLYKDGLPGDPEATARARAAVRELGAAWRRLSDEDVMQGKVPEP